MNTRLGGRRGRSGGFTLIELIVTVAIAATLMLVAVPALRSYQRNAEVASASGTLLAAINTARGEAMKRGMNVLFVPADGASWTSGWNVFVDRNRDFEFGASDLTLLMQAPLADALTLSGTASAGGGAPYLLFDASGYSKTKDGGFAAVTLAIERKDEPSTYEYTRLLKIAQSGRVRSCKPASSSDSNCSTSQED